VRRSFLCGEDKATGTNYEHRRQWIEDRIRVLSSIFPVDICAYAVMSNHLHLVVKLCPDEADLWSADETLQRWTSLFKGPLLVQKHTSGKDLNPIEENAVNDCVEVYRKRFKELGWFMKCLNEPIAKQANKEDGCTGHFWESRYKSQALLTEEALLSCMAYVDLNPVRAAMAATPEASDHTSIKERLHPQFDLAKAIQEQANLECLLNFNFPVKPLANFEGDVSNNEQQGILFSIKDYLELVDFTGRIVRSNKRGSISPGLPSILVRLNLDQKTWLVQATNFEKIYHLLFSRRRRKKPQVA